MKKKINLIWQLYPSYLIVIIASLVTASIYVSYDVETFFLKQTEKDLLVRGELLQNNIDELLMEGGYAAIDFLCKKIGKHSHTRFTVILTDGTVIGDSEESPAHMENHKNRPEMISALSGDVGASIRESETLKTRMMYIAIPLQNETRIIGALRTALPVTALQETLMTIKRRIMYTGIVATFFASILGLLVSKKITRPIEEMKRGASRFAEGKLSHRLHEPPIYELSGLAEAMNKMAAALNERIEAVKNQRNEYQAVLSSMVEGVIGIDLEEKIININNAARSILNLSQTEVKGRSIQEVVREPDFYNFIRKAAVSTSQEADDFTIHHLGKRIINTLSAPLRDASEKRIGTLIVLNDVTQVRRLDTVRKDFVANVSHEIKTPLTAIKGFVETLRANGDETQENRNRFLEIIMKHVDRLNAILEDLLVLARLEQKNSESSVILEIKQVKELVETALQVVQPKAFQKEVSLEIMGSDEIAATIDIHLIEQALVNLIDNAVKYSPEKTKVIISYGTDRNGDLLICIKDHGHGIPEEHRTRIFERFYRVDSARSRSMGGTGLGLSIVKHIASVHGGNVTVESEIGEGSVFTLCLPKRLVLKEVS